MDRVEVPITHNENCPDRHEGAHSDSHLRMSEEASDPCDVPCLPQHNRLENDSPIVLKQLSTLQSASDDDLRDVTPPTATLGTHPALASHAVTWRKRTAVALAAENGSTKRVNSPRGSFVLDDENNTLDRDKTRRNGNGLPPRRPMAKKKKTNGAKAAQGGKRGNGFSTGETESLLELLHDHLPLAKDEWEKVARLHELRYPRQKRNADSIRRKFSALCRTVPPTGDPTIPGDVLKAKAIRKEMTERADIGDSDDLDREYTEDMPDDTLPFSRSGTPATNSSSASPLFDNPPAPRENNTNKEPETTIARAASIPPRPLVRKRPSKAVDDDDSLFGAIKASMLQEQMRRDEEHRQRMFDREMEKERREEECRIREQERLDERERRAEERQRNDRMTQMMMIAVLGTRAKDVFGGDSLPENG